MSPSQSPHPDSHTYPQRPEVQVTAAARGAVGHAIVVDPRPSLLHTLRVVALAHDAIPGVHCHVWQRPIAQLEPDAHDDVTADRPSG